jgi:hypothetical protein
MDNALEFQFLQNLGVYSNKVVAKFGGLQQ